MIGFDLGMGKLGVLSADVLYSSCSYMELCSESPIPMYPISLSIVPMISSIF